MAVGGWVLMVISQAFMLLGLPYLTPLAKFLGVESVLHPQRAPPEGSLAALMQVPIDDYVIVDTVALERGENSLTKF